VELAESSTREPEPALAQSVRRWFRIGSFALVFVAIATLLWLKRPVKPSRLGNFGTVPSFVMRDQSGAQRTEKDFRGAPWIADFIFIRCTESCPMLTSRMSNVSRELTGSGVRLASFSLDPENDTPEELAIYAAKWHADEKNWSFMTGPIADVQRVVTAGFKVGFTRMGEKDGVPDIQHGNWLVLVDGAGTIRGYFRAEDESDRHALVESARALALEGTK
jgi:protein SCO1